MPLSFYIAKTTETIILSRAQSHHSMKFSIILPLLIAAVKAAPSEQRFHILFIKLASLTRTINS